jgi:hypothetical protein
MNSSVAALQVLAAVLGLGTAFAQNDRPALPEAPPPAARELTPEQRQDLRKMLQRGLSFDRVRELLGPPHRVARQVLFHRYLEQWVYGPPYDFRIEFDCLRGQKAQLLTVHSLRPE